MFTNIHIRNLSDDVNGFVLGLQIGSIFVIFAMGFIFGMLPLWIKSCRENSNVLSIINTFSGGIFLGLGLFHQLPEANEMLEDNPIQEHYPFTYLLAFITYSLILFIEKVATDAHNIADAHHHHEEKKKEEKQSNSSIEGKQNNEQNNIEKNNNEIAQIMLKANNEENNIEKRLETNKENKHNILQSEENNINSNKENYQEVKVYTQKQINDEIKNETLQVEKEKKGGFKGLLEPIIVLCAIGFHGLFAGISIGIGENLNDTLIIIIAILAHKWAAALSLGVTFVKLFVPNKQFYILMTIFALITPVGTVIGLIVKQSSNELVEAIFLSVSSGTFFYLSMSEILVEEFEKKENKYIKFTVFVVGCLAISFLVFFE